MPLCLRVPLSLLLVSHAVGYNILIYNPQVGHSHVSFWGKIADILVEAGHNVVSFIKIREQFGQIRSERKKYIDI